MKFIKTLNSPVSLVDLAEELEIRDIQYKMGDDGLWVAPEDYDSAMDILMQLEEEEEE